MKALSELCKQFRALYCDLFEIKIEHNLEDFISIGDTSFVFCRLIDDYCEIGLVLDANTVTVITSENPFARLTSANLESFFVFTEELSHLIQLLQLAERNQMTTRVGLEKVAEIDKLIISSALLELQTRIPHLDLMRKILSEHCINVRQEKVYDEAPKALLMPCFKQNRSIVADVSWRREVKKFKAQLLLAG